MITIQKLTKDNWHDTLNLEILPAQKHYVQDITYYIAKAYIMPEGLFAAPFTLYHEHQLVGFFSMEVNAKTYWIRGFRIDHRFQNRGFGTEALYEIRDMLRRDYLLCKAFCVEIAPDNKPALKIVTQLEMSHQSTTPKGMEVYHCAIKKRNRKKVF